MLNQLSVSVVIATFNRGSRIRRTLDSVLAQTVPPAEIIVIDDESTDDTGSWIQAHYPDIRVLRYPNGGTSMARNRGAAVASCDVLVFLDHDDDMQPHAIDTLTTLLHRFPEARAAYSDHTLRDVNSGEYFANHHTAMTAFHRMRAIETIRRRGDGRLYGEAMHRALLHGNLLQQPWAIYRETFADLGGFDRGIRYCEDWDMYLRVTRRFPVAVTDAVISDHYIEGENLHRVAGQEEQHMKVLHKHIRATSPFDFRVQGVLRRRLAGYHKAAGDKHRINKEPGALLEYFRSFRWWPFDFVVAARCLLWSFSAIGKTTV